MITKAQARGLAIAGDMRLPKYRLRVAASRQSSGSAEGLGNADAVAKPKLKAARPTPPSHWLLRATSGRRNGW
jgi:hypothetical protein